MTRRTDVSIREATPEDADAIAEIHMASRAVTMPYLPPQTRTHDEVTDWVARVVLSEGVVWVAVVDEAIVGYASLVDGFLEHLYLRPDRLRLGVGSMLLDLVKSQSDGSVSLYVFEANVGARAFYEHAGFVVVDRGSDNMEHLPDLTMRWVRPDMT